MIDFLIVSTRGTKRGVIEIYPKFIIKKSSDLMIRGGDFYAIWLDDIGLWSTDEQDALQLIDWERDRFAQKNRQKFDSEVKVLHNYRYFVEKETELFGACRDDCRSLIFADVDDFKRCNQLCGVEAGDTALCQISKEITLCMGESGTVFRTSGKVFGILLPHLDPSRAKTLAEEICRRVRAINRTPEGKSRKPLSLSVSICSAPYAASSAKELRDHADLAAYNAKQSGKDCITLFREAAAAPQGLAGRTELIVGRIEQEGRENGGILAMISALTAAIDTKDHYTFDHSKNVACCAASLAVDVGLNDEQVRTIYAAGLLHDICKISIPEEILRKTGKLTDSEYDVMKSHVNSSIKMIRHLPDMDYLIPAVLGHHER